MTKDAVPIRSPGMRDCAAAIAESVETVRSLTDDDTAAAWKNVAMGWSGSTPGISPGTAMRLRIMLQSVFDDLRDGSRDLMFTRVNMFCLGRGAVANLTDDGTDQDR